MGQRKSDYERIVAALVAGEAVDWTGLPDDDPDLAQLRILCDIAQVHRQTPVAEAGTAGTIGTLPPRSVGVPQSRWAHLHLLETIGEGSFGVVYRAWDSRLAREVALKLMPAGSSNSDTTLAEARRLARVHHPNVVSVYGADHIDGQVGVWMELVKGHGLNQSVKSQGPFSAREAALIGADVCSALAAVHRAGLLHRDIKPQNVVREHRGRIVLMDFGAGREIADDASIEVIGTPAYMAPELFGTATATVQSDVYGVGALLFFLTTGTTPVAAATLAEVRQAHSVGAARALRDVQPDLPREFIEIVDRALSSEPTARFETTGDLERALLTTVGARLEPSATTAASVNPSLLTRRLPSWAVVAMAIPMALGLLVVQRMGPVMLTGRSRNQDSAATRPVAAHPLTADQHKIAFGFEELAASLASQGEWPGAIEHYLQAERIYRINTSPDAPIVAATLAKIGWAQQQAGQIDKAQANFELAFAKFQEFNVLPLMENVLGALASSHQAAGRPKEAVETIDRALQIRRRVFGGGREDASGLTSAGIPPARLMQSMPSVPLQSDADADWLPDVLEAAVGLNPSVSDSDGDGLPDGDEDADGDGFSNWLEFGLTVNPTRILAQYGGLDPESLGFRQDENRRVAGHPVTSERGPAWNVPSTGQGVYYRPLTSAQRADALSRGWRMATRGTFNQGAAFANVDFGPDGPRFNLEFFHNNPNAVSVQLDTSIVPYEGPIVAVSETRSWPLVELVYDPSVRLAALRVSGTRRPVDGYAGHRQFQEGLGFFFGAFTNFGKSPQGDADFNFSILTIR